MGNKIRVKGVNGTVVELDSSVAAGLLDAGHVVRVDGDEPEQPPQAEQPEGTPPVVAEPAGNASAEAWRAYALGLGYDEEQLKDLGREDIKKLVDN